MSKFDLSLRLPVMNAAGSLGFAPDPHGMVDLARLGAFITNPISLQPRSPARGTRYLATPGGFLLHTGYPNSGLKAVLRRYAERWARATIPVLVHLLAPESLDEISIMVRMLEGVEGVTGIELGLPPDFEAQSIGALLQAAIGELPLVLRLPLDRAVGLSAALFAAGTAPDVSAVSLGPPRGAMPIAGSELSAPLHGRFYGPALFPQALEAVHTLASARLPVIGAGGVYTAAQVESMLAAGALAVQLDAVLWRSGW